MIDVYILQSLSGTQNFYTGITENLEKRLVQHNNGEVPYTSKFTPWEYKNYFAFKNNDKAYGFEKYLKSGSGRSFTKRHF